MKMKIGNELIDLSCEFKKDLYDPRKMGRQFICQYCFGK